MKIHIRNTFLLILIILALSSTSVTQKFHKKDVIGEYQFKVTWMVNIETNYRIKKNGEYNVTEIYEGKVQKGFGNWKISSDSLVLIPEFPTSGSLSQQSAIPIWVDTIGNVQLGNFTRSRQRRKVN